MAQMEAKQDSSQKARKINKMVLVEDDEGYVVLLQRLFERAKIKCELVWMPDGIKLLEYLKSSQQGSNAILLLDLNLPVLSGFEVMEELRKTHNAIELPVIIISTTIREKEFQKCIDLGANAFLKKPISYNELINVTEKMGMGF